MPVAVHNVYEPDGRGLLSEAKIREQVDTLSAVFHRVNQRAVSQGYPNMRISFRLVAIVRHRTEGTFASNRGPAFRAAAGARIDILRDPGYLDSTSSLQAHPNPPVEASGNAGGLYASGISRKVAAGGISTGDVVCVREPCPSIGQHSFTLNWPGPPFDVESVGGGTVIAVQNYWGPNRLAASLELNVEEASYAAVAPTLLQPPTATGGSSSGRYAMASLLAHESIDAEPSALRAVFWALVREAEAHAQAGQGDAAASRLIQAYRLATSDAERYAAAEAAGRALAVVQPAALLTWSQQAAALPGHDRPWARRALAVALLATGQYSEAGATAQALADEDGQGASPLALLHRVRGLTLRAEVALAVGNEAASAAALASLLSLDAEAASTLVVAHALAFPEGGALVDVPADRVLSQVAVQDMGTGLAIQPNPSAGGARVFLPALHGADRVTVTVFDALGREVRALHDGAAPGALHVQGLPAGVYVLRAVVHHADGQTTLHARSFTVAR